MCYSGCIHENRNGECKHRGGPPRICPGEETDEVEYEPDWDAIREQKEEDRWRR